MNNILFVNFYIIYYSIVLSQEDATYITIKYSPNGISNYNYCILRTIYIIIISWKTLNDFRGNIRIMQQKNNHPYNLLLLIANRIYYYGLLI